MKKISNLIAFVLVASLAWGRINTKGEPLRIKKDIDYSHQIHLENVKKQSNLHKKFEEHFSENVVLNSRSYGESSIIGHIAIPLSGNYQNVYVELHSANNEGVLETRIVDEMGNYQIACLGSGDYKIKATYIGEENIVPIWVGNSFSFNDASEISVDGIGPFSYANVTMYEGGSISGLVSGGVDGEPVTLNVYDASNQDLFKSSSAYVGDSFLIDKLYDGNFKIEVVSDNNIFEDEWYSDKSSFETADEVTVTPLNETTNIDFYMNELPPTVEDIISGRIWLSNDGWYVSSNCYVFAMSDNGYSTTVTDDDGYYSFSNLQDGDYILWATYPSGEIYQPSIFVGVDPEPESCQFEDAAIVSIINQTPISSIDIDLYNRGGTIYGNIIDDQQNVPDFASISVSPAFSAEDLIDLLYNNPIEYQFLVQTRYSNTFVDESGDYIHSALCPSSYIIYSFASGSIFYWNNEDSVFSPNNYTSADTLIIEDETIINTINFVVPSFDGSTFENGTISGSFELENHDLTEATITVMAQNMYDNSFVVPTYTGNTYLMEVQPGDYKIWASYNGYENYPNQVWYGGVTNSESAQIINISENQDLVNIDFLFEQCIEYVADIDYSNQIQDYKLYNNYPNPFNPNTQIRYNLPEENLVNVTIYDVMGRKIRSLMNEGQTAGYHSLRWDAKNDIGEGVAAGMYIYTIRAGDYRATKKMVLLK